jgi:hypothetical protein
MTPQPVVGARGHERASAVRSPLSTVQHSRTQWKHTAKERGDQDRSLRTQLARVKAERDHATQALTETHARLRQLESHAQAVVVLPKVEVVWLSLQRFLEAPSSFRAVARVLTLLAHALGIKHAPGPHTVITWVLRLSIVRIQGARVLRGVPRRSAPWSKSLLWRIESSMGLGTGKIVAVVAIDAHHHHLAPGAPSRAHPHCLGVSVAPAWTGDTLAALLGRLIAQGGRPAASLGDGGSALQQAVAWLGEHGLASPGIDALAPAVAGMLKRTDQNHPAFERFVSACGRVSGKLKHPLLACVVPPPVRTTARFLPGHRLGPWAARGLQLSPAGGAKTGSILSTLRACLEELPTWKALSKRLRAEASGGLEGQRSLKTTGLAHDTLAACDPLIDALPSAPLRLEFRASLAVQLATATPIGLDHVGVPMRSDTIASLFGGATHPGVGRTQEAARLALRLPAFCGAPTREAAEQVLGIRVARQQESTAQCPSLTTQRREVLCHPERLERLGLSQGEPPMVRIPRPKKRSNYEEIVNISKGCKNQCGPQLAALAEPLLIENVAPPDSSEAAWAL